MSDPVLDALDRIQTGALFVDHTSDQHVRSVYADARTIRDALADRITPTEARTLIEWGEHWTYGQPSPSEITLIARLGRIADRETGR